MYIIALEQGMAPAHVEKSRSISTSFPGRTTTWCILFRMNALLRGGVFLVILGTLCGVFSPITVEAVSLTETEKTWLTENQENIFFAPIEDYPPFLWSQYGSLFGISNDYLQYIQEQLSVDFKEREPRTRSELTAAMESGESSFLASLTETSDRAEYLLFTRPYLTVPTVYVGKSGMRVDTATEIVEKGLSVSVADEYGIHQYLENRYSAMHLVPVANNYLVLQNVLSGKTEVGVINVASLSHLAREHNMTNLKKLADTGFAVRLAFAVPKSMPVLRDILDNVIESMPEKTKQAIMERWVPDSASIQNLAGIGAEPLGGVSPNQNSYVIGMGALLLLCLGFILHYIFVRFTPRKDATGNTEYIP